jgi:hypothetical protein
MSQISNHRVLAAIILLAFAALLPLHAQGAAAAPDSTLYITYSLFSSSGQTTVSWVICGSTQESEGCFDSGSLGPFVAVGAMIEGTPSVQGSVVTRAIYVVDSGSASVKLYVYKRTDTITASFDTTKITLAHTVTLPLTGGTTALCSMAANSGFLFIGTDQSPEAVEVTKSNLKVTQLGGFSPPINVTAVTADQYGNVAVTQGNSSGESGFSLYGPNGEGLEDGGGADFVVGTQQAVSPAALLNANVQPASRVGYRPKASPAQAEAK